VSSENIKRMYEGQVWWQIPVIPTIWEEELEEILFKASSDKKISKTLP
jgi:hypothetical protein